MRGNVAENVKGLVKPDTERFSNATRSMQARGHHRITSRHDMTCPLTPGFFSYTCDFEPSAVTNPPPYPPTYPTHPTHPTPPRPTTTRVSSTRRSTAPGASSRFLRRRCSSSRTPWACGRSTCPRPW